MELLTVHDELRTSVADDDPDGDKEMDEETLADAVTSLVSDLDAEKELVAENVGLPEADKDTSSVTELVLEAVQLLEMLSVWLVVHELDGSTVADIVLEKDSDRDTEAVMDCEIELDHVDVAWIDSDTVFVPVSLLEKERDDEPVDVGSKVVDTERLIVSDDDGVSELVWTRLLDHVSLAEKVAELLRPVVDVTSALSDPLLNDSEMVADCETELVGSSVALPVELSE